MRSDKEKFVLNILVLWKKITMMQEGRQTDRKEKLFQSLCEVDCFLLSLTYNLIIKSNGEKITNRILSPQNLIQKIDDVSSCKCKVMYLPKSVQSIHKLDLVNLVIKSLSSPRGL